MENRTSIDLACGVIIAQNRCSQDEAMAILTRVSSNRNQKLREVAADVLRRVTSVRSPYPLRRLSPGGPRRMPRMKGMTTTRLAPFSLRSIAVPAFGPALMFGLGEGAILPVVALSARDLGASVPGLR